MLRESFVILSDIIPDAVYDLRYYGSNNFIGKRIDGYEESCAIITKTAAEALKKVSEELKNKGYRLKIFDCYRPQKAVDHFVRWVKDLSDTKMKAEFYPDVDKSELFSKGYIAEKSSHSRGSTVDLTLVDAGTNEEIDMGSGFDFFSEISHPDFIGELTEKQRENRRILKDAMLSHGFLPLDSEWWHFTLSNEPFANEYFDFDIKRSSIE